MPDQKAEEITIQGGERAEWLRALEQLVDEAECWAKKQSWHVRREMVSLQEDRLGSYDAPSLHIMVSKPAVFFQPVARYIVGAEGRVDLYRFPTYDTFILVRSKGRWQFVATDTGPLDPPLPWNEETFVRLTEQLEAAS